ncbi:hypothetical protein [Pseudonocardia alni]|uniref:hypothetical protein n=1 Tax=Pseudonocardia alni TaxID=33907 RepID=UPI00279F568D|nr:hypothetical protein PaSha_12790 [Pseudonocardia alni]
MIVGSVAAASLTDVGMGMVTAPLIGCGLAMFRRPDPILDLLGACAALILLIASLSDTCGGTLRVLVLVMALGTFGGGLAVGRTLGVRGPGPGLALFGALDLARFAAAPLGAAWDVRELDSVVLVVAAVGVLGLIVGVAPRLSLILVAVAIAYAEIAIAPVTGSGPCASSSPDRAVTIAAFLIGYAAVRAVRTRSVN